MVKKLPVLLIGKIFPEKVHWEHKNKDVIDLTPWKYVQPVSFTLFSAVILIYLILRKNTLNSFYLYSYSFILGGTVGNGIDRIFKGFVVDFINLNFINFPVFNIADISINIGFIFLLYSIFKNKR